MGDCLISWSVFRDGHLYSYTCHGKIQPCPNCETTHKKGEENGQ